jgi:hypothetical protein
MCETDMTATVHMCETRAPTPTIMRSVGITHARRSPPILALCLREPIASRFSGACTRLKKEETVATANVQYLEVRVRSIVEVRVHKIEFVRSVEVADSIFERTARRATGSVPPSPHNLNELLRITVIVR